RTGVALGPLTDAMLATIRVRKTIMSVGGVGEEGLYNSNVLLTTTERAMMQAADEVILVADSTKFGRKNLTCLSPLSEIDRLVVDSDLSEEWRQRLAAAGVALTIAPSPQEPAPSSGTGARA
ncbi:MAG TPA: DeoR/GlpR transcriptional regulator, partial [Pirellulales bacterium]